MAQPRVHTVAHDRSVYFDIWGVKLFLITWDSWKSFNWVVIAFVVFYFCYKRGLHPPNWIGLFLSFALHCIGQLCGFCIALLLGLSVHKFGVRMSWYSNHYHVIGLYILPFMFWFVFYSTFVFRELHAHCGWARKLCDSSKWSRPMKLNQFDYSRMENDFFDASTLILTLLLLLLNVLDRPGVFVLTLWIVGTLCGRLAYRYLIPHVPYSSLFGLLFTILPVFSWWHLYLSLTLFEVMIPISGRSGHVRPQEVLISLLAYFCLSPVVLFLLGHLHCTSKDAGRALRILLLNACVAYALLVHSSNYGFPYSVQTDVAADNPYFSPRFQRLSVFHVDRTIGGDLFSEAEVSKTSSVYILPWDSNGVRYLTPNAGPKMPETENMKLYGLRELINTPPHHCNFSLPYCGIPFFRGLFHIFTDFYSIPAKPHNAEPSPRLKLVSRVLLKDFNPLDGRVVWNYTFSIESGPPQIIASLRFDVPYVRLSNWSFASESPVPVPMPLVDTSATVPPDAVGAHYFIDFMNAAATTSPNADPWVFWLLIDKSKNVSTSYFDMAVMGIHMDLQQPSCPSHQLNDTVSRLPPWVSVNMWCASYDHFRFELL